MQVQSSSKDCSPDRTSGLRWGLLFLASLGVFFAAFFSPLPVRAEPLNLQKKETDRAITQALAFLAKQQQPSGCWRNDNFAEMTGITSLAIMSFLAAGHVPGEGPYADNLSRGIKWVIDHQKPDGMLTHQVSHGPMYCHGISTLMLAEVAGMLPKREAVPVKQALQKAVRLILDSQDVRKHPLHAGGWRYQSNSPDSDLSVTGWQLLALRAAKDIGCDVPAEYIDRAIDYVKRCSQRGRAGFTYQPNSEVTPVRTGTGVLALEVCGDHHSQEVMAAADYLIGSPPRYQSGFFFYGAYYCSVGMFKVGGKHWDAMRDSLYRELIPRQGADGGWSPDNSEMGGGRNYATAMAVLALAVEYQYLPIYQR